MIITIAGLPGSGKSTISRYLEKKFGLKRYNIGDLRRKLALERGMTIDQLNKLGEREPWTDKDIDDFQKKVGKTEDNFVIDGRLSWFFIPNSIKLFLTVDLKVGAERIFRAKRKSEIKYNKVEDVLKEINERVAGDKKRYNELYGVDPYKIDHYDIIIDTSNLSEEETCQIVERAVRSFE